MRRPTSSTPATLTHLDRSGQAQMVDVGHKPVTSRRAIAEAFVVMAPQTLRAIAAGRLPKGEVLSVARLAGIMAAKRTGELIPLAHRLSLDSASVDFDLPELDAHADRPVRLRILATACIRGKTGVEMEALTAVSVAALTIYDMCKAIDRAMSIDAIRLLSKTGGTRHNQTGRR